MYIYIFIYIICILRCIRVREFIYVEMRTRMHPETRAKIYTKLSARSLRSLYGLLLSRYAVCKLHIRGERCSDWIFFIFQFVAPFPSNTSIPASIHLPSIHVTYCIEEKLSGVKLIFFGETLHYNGALNTETNGGSNERWLIINS